MVAYGTWLSFTFSIQGRWTEQLPASAGLSLGTRRYILRCMVPWRSAQDAKGGRLKPRSLWLIRHGLHASQVPLLAKIALSSLRKRSHCRPTFHSQQVQQLVFPPSMGQIPAFQTEHQVSHNLLLGARFAKYISLNCGCAHHESLRMSSRLANVYPTSYPPRGDTHTIEMISPNLYSLQGASVEFTYIECTFACLPVH